MKITLFAVDDSDEYLDSLCQIFKPYAEQYDLVKTFSALEDEDGVEEMIDEIYRLKPDIVLMDISFVIKSRPDDFGIELTQRIIKRVPEQKVIMLSGDNLNTNLEQLQKIRRSFRIGAIAYLRKNTPLAWFEAIKETIQGHLFIPPDISRVILQCFSEGNTFKLTEREIEVLHLLSQDNNLREIAKLMNIGYDGVNFHVGNAKVKLGVTTLQGLVAKAMRQGVL